MAVFDKDVNSRPIVKYNNREFIFSHVNNERSDKVELVFVRTLFRKSSIVTNDYRELEDIPSEVITCMANNGYEVVNINPTEEN